MDQQETAGFTEAADVLKDGDLRHISSFTKSTHPQTQSPLFSRLPAEIRDEIYSYTFADYEDLDNLYDFDTCYRRPGYFGPRKTHTALLQTCQAIYNDCWFMPWTLARQTFFLAGAPRRPEKSTSTEQVARTVQLIEQLHPDVPERRKEIANVQVFAQLCELECGGPLSDVLDISLFRPKNITITVRHTDIWDWERDAPIAMFTSTWVWSCKFPSTVTNICFQLESLERKKEQVDNIMQQIQTGWYFTRADHVHMVPVAIGPTSKVWVGSSSWEGERWVRDEDDAEPGKIRYYIASLCFTPAKSDDDEDRVARDQQAMREGVDVPKEIARRSTLRTDRAFLTERQMELAGVTADTPASVALDMVPLYDELNEDPYTLSEQEYWSDQDSMSEGEDLLEEEEGENS